MPSTDEGLSGEAAGSTHATSGVPSPHQATLSRRGKWALVILLTITIVVLLVLAEVAMRVRQTIRYGTTATAEEFYADDPATGLRVPIANKTKGGISINSLGFRGPEIAVPKGSDTLRIAFVGASTTWCAEVTGNDYAWPHIVTASVAQAFPGAHFDYVNAGVVGFTVDSSLENLKVRVAPLQPDIIVIYEGINDVVGELRDLAFRRGIIADEKFEEYSWFGRYSVLWNLVEKNARVLASRHQAKRDRGRLDVDASALGEKYRTELTELVNVAKQHARLVAVATLATRVRRGQAPEEQADALASAIFYMPFITAQGLIEAYARYNQIIAEVARETGSLLIRNEDAIPGDAAHFTDSVHFTDAGSRAMAERVSRALIAEIAKRRIATPVSASATSRE